MKLMYKNKGVSVIEVMIALVIFSLIFAFIFQTFTLFFESQRLTLHSTQALYLAEEGQEILHYLRDDDWMAFSSLTLNTEYYLEVATSTLATSNTPEVIDGMFTRSFMLTEAYRNGDDDLVDSGAPGAVADPENFIVIMNVEWGDGHVVELQSLITNLHNI